MRIDFGQRDGRLATARFPAWHPDGHAHPRLKLWSRQGSQSSRNQHPCRTSRHEDVGAKDRMKSDGCRECRSRGPRRKMPRLPTRARSPPVAPASSPPAGLGLITEDVPHRTPGLAVHAGKPRTAAQIIPSVHPIERADVRLVHRRLAHRVDELGFSTAGSVARRFESGHGDGEQKKTVRERAIRPSHGTPVWPSETTRQRTCLIPSTRHSSMRRAAGRRAGRALDVNRSTPLVNPRALGSRPRRASSSRRAGRRGSPRGGCL
jgi:hypothetical protein